MNMSRLRPQSLINLSGRMPSTLSQLLKSQELSAILPLRALQTCLSLMLSSILLLQSVVMLIWNLWSHTPARRTTRPTTRIIECENNYFDRHVYPGHSPRKHAYCYVATLPPESLVTRLSV